MKSNKTSFLFFCFIVLNFIDVFNNRLISQTTQDSTLIYYKSLIKIKDVDLTSKAFDFFKNKYDAALNQNDTINAAYYLELISFGQFKMGFVHDSELTTVKALSLIDRIKDQRKTLEPRKRLLNRLGMIYRKIEDYDAALRFYNQALKLNDVLLDKISILTNIANTYADKENYNKAVEVLIPYYEKVLELENIGTKAVYLDNLGYFQSKIGNPNALGNMEQALNIRMNLEDLVGLFSSYRHLSLFYLEKNNKAKAIKFSKNVKEISKQMGSPAFALEALELELRLEKNQNFTRYVELANTIQRKKQQMENTYAAIKYNFQEKEKEAQRLELQIKDSQLKAEKEKLNKTIFQSVAALGLLITVFLYLFIKDKHKKEKLQQVYNTETRISKKVHDEVANDIYHIMTKIQKTNVIKEDVLDDLEDVYNKTRDISKETSIIDLHGPYEEYLRDLLLSYASDDVNIITKDFTDVNWNGLDDTKKAILYRVLQELMTNMRKHSKATLVVLSFSQNGKKIMIDYKDNGVGCNLIKNSGLHNTENRIESINGTITFESQVDNGFKATLTV
ncbi:tetratricopeptide repeat protein [Yeosuana marina]|uniref:tetratricopeptide repeat protein n=1 Tax=Yeosuana marina TaxID=1565536 RepID=UPI0030EBE124|tara:strand:- start:1503 stop:3188 length:1686 start_codon:yes stop_codon:yes gene_type:complete